MLDQEQIINSFSTLKKYEDYLFHKAWMQAIFIFGIFSLLYSLVLIPYTLEIQNINIRENFPFPEFLGIFIAFCKAFFLILTLIGLIIVFFLFRRVKRTITKAGTIIDKREFSLLIVFLTFWFLTGIFPYLFNNLWNELITIPYLTGQFDSELINDILYYIIYCETHLSINLLALAAAFLFALVIFWSHKSNSDLNYSFQELLSLGIIFIDLSILSGTLIRTINLSPALEYFDSSNVWIINPTMFYIGLAFLIIYLIYYLTNNHQNKKILLISGIILFSLSFLTGRFVIIFFYEAFKFNIESINAIQSIHNLLNSFINSIILIGYAFYLRKRNNKLLEY